MSAWRKTRIRNFLTRLLAWTSWLSGWHRPYDPQGEVEPFNVDQDWRDRA